MARAVVDECRARGVVPVLVGGSALYTRAVLDRFVLDRPVRLLGVGVTGFGTDEAAASDDQMALPV